MTREQTGADLDPIERARTLLRRVAGLATLAMLGLSWPLWIDGGPIPRVPFFAGRLGEGLPTPVSWGIFGALMISVAGTALARSWRPWFAASAVLLAVLVLRDQHRFQPWTYQYLMTMTFLTSLPGGWGLRVARWWFASLYIHSGLSKLDWSFCSELGPVFLGVLAGPFGLGPGHWPFPTALLMPAGEIVVGVLLIVPETRRAGRIGALLLHGTLLLILGPLGFGHSVIILIWNVAVMLEVWVGFRPGLPSETSGLREFWHWPVAVLFWAGVCLPLTERWEYFDAWPSHALYSSHVGRVAILIGGEIPVELARFCRPIEDRGLSDEDSSEWRRLDLTAWSRDARGTPVYPQNRACLGLAEGLSARYGNVARIRVAAWGPASLWEGSRKREDGAGLAGIHQLGDRYLFNARAAR